MTNEIIEALPAILEAVNNYGNSFVLQKPAGSSTYDPTNGNVTPTFTDIPFKGGVEVIKLKDVKGSVQVGDIEIIAVFEDSTVEVDNDDRIQYRGDTYSVVIKSPLETIDKTVAWYIVARK